MSVNNSEQENYQQQIKKNRQFGVLVGGVLCSLTIYLSWQKGSLNVYLFAPAMLLLLMGIFLPGALTLFRIAWEKLGRMLGLVNTYIILTLVYLFIFVPYGLLLKALQKDMLGLKMNPDAKTYWQKRSEKGSSMKHQF